jgi:transposase-like protein
LKGRVRWGKLSAAVSSPHGGENRSHGPDPACPARGLVGAGNIGVHSQAEQRYRCARCGRTFAATTGTAFYRLRTAADLVTLVLTLLSHGCPPQAIVAALRLGLTM